MIFDGRILGERVTLHSLIRELRMPVPARHTVYASMRERAAMCGRCGSPLCGPEATLKVVDALFCKRPFGGHIDPTQDGAEIVNMVRPARAELLRRIGVGDLLVPRDFSSSN